MNLRGFFQKCARMPIKNAKFPGNYFFIKANTKRDFQICISVPLIYV